MTKLSSLFALAIAVALPGIAKADFVLEASLGKGATVSPKVENTIGQTNLLISGGWGLGEILRAEVGVVADLPQDNEKGADHDFNLRVRPMLVIDPPVLPVYGRLILGVANLLDESRAFEFGGAVGAGFTLGPLGFFAELGALPQSADGEFLWILEGRAGGQIFF